MVGMPTRVSCCAPADASKHGRPLVYVNPAFCSLLGQPKGELLGTHLAALLLSSELVCADVASFEQALGGARETLVELVGQVLSGGAVRALLPASSP